MLFESERKKALKDNKSRELSFRAGTATLQGTLVLPKDAVATVIFAHGSGSSRFSPRNKKVATVLNQAGLGTFLFDLLSADEEKTDEVTAALRFDIGFLAERLVAATAYLIRHEDTHLHRFGYFGASTGAAAALVAASELPRSIGAIVSRGGRPDLANAALPFVDAPTLLIVGGADLPVITMNQQAYDELKCKKKLEIVPGATHLFEESGALDTVAALASKWFMHYLVWEPKRQQAISAS